MGTVTVGNSYPLRLSSHHQKNPLFRIQYYRKTRNKHNPSSSTSSPVVTGRLFGPSIFEASKLKVLLLGVDDNRHPGNVPRTYTFTHSDLTANLTLAISKTLNSSQVEGWYNKLQRDEVVAEWKKVKGKMTLHVHCHISGGHFLLNLFAPLRYFIFRKELPLVLKAFVYGDENLLNNYPELKDAMVWVYFHSDIPDFNKVECWGSLANHHHHKGHEISHENEEESSHDRLDQIQVPKPCQEACVCCFPPIHGSGGAGILS